MSCKKDDGDDRNVSQETGSHPLAESPRGRETDESPLAPPLTNRKVEQMDDSESLVQFVFDCKPSEVPRGSFTDSFYPDTYMAFWSDDGDEMLVGDWYNRKEYRVICFKKQDRASGKTYYTWYCELLGPANPASESFMRSISS